MSDRSIYRIEFRRLVDVFAEYKMCLLVCAACYFFCAKVHCQTVVSSDQLLFGSAVMDSNLIDDLDQLHKVNGRLPTIDKMEFRSETDQWNLGRQEYLFRVSFNSPKIKNVQQQLSHLALNELSLKMSKLTESDLLKRYAQIIEWRMVDGKIKLLKEKKLILEDKITIYQRMMSDPESQNISGLWQAKNELLELDREIERQAQKRIICISQLIAPNEETSVDFKLDTSNWISVEKSMDHVAGVIDAAEIPGAFELQKNEIERTNLKFDLKEAKRKKILDFAQVKYAEKGNQNFAQEWSLGFGLNIPTKASYRNASHAYALDAFEEKLKLHIQEKSLTSERQINLTTLESVRAEYELVCSHIEEQEMHQTYDSIKGMSELSPLTLMELKMLIVESELIKISIESEFYLQYVQCLYDNGKLFGEQRINYLKQE